MRNPALENCILKILARVPTGLKAKTLQAETELAMDRPDLTTDEFLDALNYLADKALIRGWSNLFSDIVWGIEEAGISALKGL